MTNTIDQTDKAQAMAVAQTILAQMGGREFQGMCGVKALHCLTEKLGGLRIKLPSNFAKNGINVVTVVLSYDDTYDVVFGKARGTKYTVVSTHDMVYCDDLQDLFERQTGMLVTLFPRR